LKGCTQFAWPFLVYSPNSVPSQNYGDQFRQVFWLPRSSSSLPIPINRNSGIWSLKEFPFRSKRKEQGHSGGTTPDLHGIPY